MTNTKKERMLELLSDQAIFDLNDEELMELERLKSQFPDWDDYLSFEITAAAIGISNIKVIQLPEKLRIKILDNAENFYGSAINRQEIENPEFRNTRTFVPPSLETGRLSEKPSFWQWLGWGVAFAACLLLVVNLWLTRFQPQPEVAKVPTNVQTPTPELSIFQKRDQLIAVSSDIVRTTMESPKGTKDISGDVVWSNSRQKGYVTFHGLHVNNPSKETYQLWVFDGTKNDKYPVSGGVFDVSENGDVVVPINTELKIDNPKMFAVTEEKPGGVVVSDREKLVAIAKI